MPNWREFFGEPGGNGNGGGARLLHVIDSQPLPWPLSPELIWSVPITFKDIDGPALTGQALNVSFTAGQNSDGTLVATFSGGNLEDDVLVNIAVAADDDASDISAAVEAAIDAEGDLDDTVSATADNGGDVDIEFVADIGRVSVTWQWVPDWQTWAVQFGGMLVDGNFDATYVFEGYNPIVVRTVRAAGTPADVAAMAVQHETDTEGNAQLVGLVVSADDDATDTNDIVFETGAPDVTITCQAPGTATMTPTETTGSVTVATTEIVQLNLGELAPRGTFPVLCDRLDVSVEVTEAWGAGRTLIVGDADVPDGAFGDTPLDLNTEARTAADIAAAEWSSGAHYEAAWDPIATLDIGDPATLTEGALTIEIGWSPVP